MLKQDIIIKPYLTTNKYNEDTYGTLVTEKCRIEKHNKLVTNEKGEEVLSSCQIIVDGTSSVTIKSNITLPDGTSPDIISLEDNPDENGVSYYKCIYT